MKSIDLLFIEYLQVVNLNTYHILINEAQQYDTQCSPEKTLAKKCQNLFQSGCP